MDAFPSPGVLSANGQVQGAYAGMTLRDYFAAKAMQGAVAGLLTGATLLNANANEIAKAAYVIADAMLEARKC